MNVVLCNSYSAKPLAKETPKNAAVVIEFCRKAAGLIPCKTLVISYICCWLISGSN